MATETTATDIDWRWRSELLGEPRVLDLPRGSLRCFECGKGPTVVFAHGWLANANLWRAIVQRLATDFTCVTLDLPLGGHTLALNADADLTPEGCGALISDALDALDATEVTLVGNDSGGAYSQIAAAARPGRIARLALNSCETPYDEFPPAPFDGLPAAARDPQTLGQLLGALRDRAVRTAPVAYGLLLKRPIEDVVWDSYALPCLYDEEILRDTAKAMSSASAEPVRRAGAQLIENFKGPVLLAWPTEDRVFPYEHAERYATALPHARLEPIADAYSFTPEDQPERLAEILAAFAGSS